MVINIFFSIGAIFCAAITAKYIWNGAKCFKIVYNDVKQELTHNINEGENY